MLVIIAKNQTAGNLLLSQLMAPDRIIPASGQVTLTDDNPVTEIQNDTELFGYVTNNQVLFNVDGLDYTKQQSLWLFQSVSPKYNNTAVAAPTINDDEDAGYSKGSVWIYGGKTYSCVTPAAGASVWYVGSESDTELGQRTGVGIAITSPITINSTSPRVIGTYPFPGTDSFLPTTFTVIAERNGTRGTVTVDIIDITNVTTIASINFSASSLQKHETTSLNNLPSSEAIFQWRAYKSARNASRITVHFFSLK